MSNPLLFSFILLLQTSTMAQASTKLHYFEWFIINDTVMGGRSDSRLVIGNDELRFEGHLSLENNGGFASFRAPLTLEKPAPKQISFRIKGDGKRYQMRMRVDQYLDGPAFVSEFDTQKGQWQTIRFDESDFELMFRGRKMRSEYQLNFADIRSIGFMVGAKQQGPFKLHIKQMQFNDVT